MKYFITGLIIYCCGFMETSAIGLNEWTFDRDAAGLTLSQAGNSGTQSAVFPVGGAGFLETDGTGSLLCTRAAAGADDMWTGGAVLDADVTNAVSGVRYFRIDCDYDLTSASRICGTVFGLSVIDETGSNVVRMVLMKGDKTPPSGSEMKHIQNLPSVGRISAILKVDMDAGTMTSWYSFDGESSFHEYQPSASDIPIRLSSIDKLRFQATGDFRPDGTSDYVAADIVRTAATWDAIVLPASFPLSVNAVFQDNMVLQRDMNVPVWGRMMPGSEVTLKLDGVTVDAVTADEDGRWMAAVDPQADDGGQPHTLQVISGAQSFQFNDVVFGDVYLASGQSNMEMPMSGYSAAAIGYSEELAVADSFPLIRHVVLPGTSSAEVQDEPSVGINWTKCSQASLGDFSAVGYFFAKEIYQKTGVPVGLILAAWGGKPIDRFLSPSGVAAVPELSGVRQYQEEGGLLTTYDIYNAMIAPIIPYGLKGVIWYQGEANGYGGNIYKYKMQALARGWRQNWGQGDFPFYYVQLTSYETTAYWTTLRDAQTAALSETNFGMAVTIDIGDNDNIHPLNKLDVGQRLARWALAKDYGQDVVYSGPLYRSSVVEGSQIRVVFDYADGGLIVGQKESTNAVLETDGPLQNFEIAGSDRNFVAAEALIDRDTVLVSADGVSSPMYARYCWSNAPDGSNMLYNAAGLPASPFTGSESYNLDVISGTGTVAGQLPGTQRSIAANTPVSGKVFDRWIGAASEIANPNASSTTVTMPEHSLYLLATYRDTSDPVYTNTVHNGTGSGTSQAGSVLNIEATVPAGHEFVRWDGDTQTVEDVSAASTTLRMPSGNVTVTAVFRTIDSVGDGVDDEWRAAYFGGDGTTTNSQSAANSDPDGDGMTNAQEFRAGTSPVDAQSKLYLTGKFAGMNATIQFATVGGRRYLLEKSSTLLPPAWETVCYNITGDGGRKEIPLSLGNETSGFCRARLNY